ncbi:hypothetical protein ACFV27_00740 [Streptomyces antimycoticus]|uniref:hypothetical protein n=1 Tax=Streptomyces antimycoticus TaxID=68175 RepID=UPI00367BED95
MGTLAVACLVTVVVCFVLVRIAPTRGMAVPFFWIGAYALVCLVSIPVVHVVYGVTEALGWRR